jgi:5'-3' exonuclease
MNQPDFFKEKKSDVKYDWSENQIFIEKYEKMYLESIIKLVGKKEYKNSKVIFCLDSPKETIWRSKLVDDYKGDRFDMELKNNFKPTFKLTYENFIPKLIKENEGKIFSVKFDKLEADDLIALISKKYQQEKSETKIYLISGDKDFLQLGRENLVFLNYKAKKPIVLTNEEAKEALKNKILTGDCSDNICPIFPKDRKILSLKKRKEIIENNDELLSYLNENPDIKKKYELNQKLINFDYIPKKLQDELIKKIPNV